jgi:hypothetical protein
MNIIEMKYRIDNSLDRVNSPRFDLWQYVDAIRKAERRIVNDRVAPIREPRNYSVERSQRIVEELYTLVVESNPITPVNNVIPVPTENQYMLLVQCIVNGKREYSRPMTHIESSDIEDNPFSSPKQASSKNFSRIRHTTFSGGIRLHSGSATSLTNVVLTYIKEQAKVSLGKPSDIIEDDGVLVIGNSYYALEESLSGGIDYFPGEVFVATNALLTSGKVLPANVIINSELPERLHDEICNIAGMIMSGGVDDYNKSQSLDNEALKS